METAGDKFEGIESKTEEYLKKNELPIWNSKELNEERLSGEERKN